ncbi:la-related protein 7 [Nylanderia fulva]|uniref:la-related protein 7 n=1 Tax=Nylanderia fulva TaxID=613905 RepID=UPI0010FB3567|nr:la-related protein 7 [Nylanderia fulva]XP_029174095.1 la-related protein 7 [Nylanderia fulva]
MVMEEQVSDMELASENIPVPQVQEVKIDTIKKTNKSNVSLGKPRLRKKALHASILKQMEFYFSDANLNKDRFLSELLKQSPYIDLEVFTQFNKLRELTTDTNRIAKALQKSTMLKVSEDGTKVYRLTPINKKENVDQCTVYVQNLPPDADHDWLKFSFSKFGSVEYVSIPRYKSNRKIKGFAFIEFDTPSSAQECIKTFQNKGCVLPYNTAPHDVLSISTFDETNKGGYSVPTYDVNSKIKSEDIKENESEDESKTNENIHNNEMDIADNNDRQNPRKRKLVSENSFTLDESLENIKTKKKRKESVDHSIINQQNEKEKTSKDEAEDNDKICDNETDVANNTSRQNVKKKKVVPEKLCVTDESDIKVEIPENNSTENQEILYKSNNRNKIAEKKKRKVTMDDINIAEDISGEVKKESHKSTKSKNKEIRLVHPDTNDDGKVTSNEVDCKLQSEKNPKRKDSGISIASIDEKKKKRNRKKRTKIQEDDICYSLGLQVMLKPDWKRLRNKYLELQKAKMQLLKGHLKKGENITGKKYDTIGQNYKCKDEKDNRKINETEKSVYGRINYTPGIIVKIEMDEPCTDPQSFKMEFRDNNSVKYIDVTHGSCEAYIRCDTVEAAQSFVQKSYEGRCLTVLKDDDEKSYWDKIARDRDLKLNKKGRIKQRGRDKLLKRAEKKLGKCIKFDQD